MNDKFYLPEKKGLVLTGSDDPLPYYYLPLFGRLYRLRLQRIMDIVSLSDRSGQRCLDIGFGSGILFPELSKKIENLYGIEIHDNIAKVKKSPALSRLNLRLLKSDILNISFKDQSFDLVLCSSVLEHIPDLRRAFSEIKRVLKKDGELVLSIPHTGKFMSFIFKRFLRIRDINSKHVSSHETIRKILAQEFRILNSNKIRVFPLLPPVYYCFLVKKSEYA